MDKHLKDEVYLSLIDESDLNALTSLLKDIINKQNEIIDWINSQ